MSTVEERRYRIEPLDPDRHDRTGFSCGVSQVDNFIRKTANKLAEADNLRVFIMTEDGRTIIGFYAINAHAVRYDDLPPAYARKRPGHGYIPAAYISMIGRDQRFAGQAIGGHLLVDCLLRITKAADQIGLSVVMLDVLDCGDGARTARRVELYTGYGFRSLPSNPMRMFLPVATVKKMMHQATT
jgi:hypothetical protein